MPEAFSLGVIIDKMIDGYFIQSHGGKLYGINNTSQVLCVELNTQKGVNPSLVSPNLTLQRSKAK